MDLEAHLTRKANLRSEWKNIFRKRASEAWRQGLRQGGVASKDEKHSLLMRGVAKGIREYLAHKPHFPDSVDVANWASCLHRLEILSRRSNRANALPDS